LPAGTSPTNQAFLKSALRSSRKALLGTREQKIAPASNEALE
jgi:hypothetical protein